jgi:hypothetical protein
MPSGRGATHNGKSINHRRHYKRTNHTLTVAVELQATVTVNQLTIAGHINQPQRLMPINRCGYLKPTAMVNRLTVVGHVNQLQRLMPINRGGWLNR